MLATYVNVIILFMKSGVMLKIDLYEAGKFLAAVSYQAGSLRLAQNGKLNKISENMTTIANS